MSEQADLPEKRSVRILVADGDPNVRFGLAVLLGQGAGFCVQGQAAEARQLLDRVEGGCPDAIVLDWQLQGMAVETLLARIRALCPGVALVVLSAGVGARRVALAAGADRFVSKSEPPAGLIAAIRSAAQTGDVQAEELDDERR
jgi:DNA-binding NarL/FixJ family response regulator